MPSLLCRPIKEERMDLDYLCDRELVQESYDQDDENVINFGVQTKGDDHLMEISAQEYQESLTLGFNQEGFHLILDLLILQKPFFFKALIDATFRKTVKFYREEQLSTRNCMTPIPPELWKKCEKMNDKAASFEATPFYGDDAMWRVVTATRLSGRGGSLHTVWASAFRWQPYAHVLHRLPDFCTQGQAIWTTRCWKFCWAIREPHESGRVVRQFGYIQDVPKRPMIKDNTAFLLDHAHSMSGYPRNNWEDHHSAVRRHWNRREEFVLRDLEEGDPGSVYEGYYEWFMVNNCRSISNPGEVLNNIRVSTERFREKREDDNLLDEELDKHLDDIINQTHAALTLGANDEMEEDDTQILVDEDPFLPSQPPPGKKAKPCPRDKIGGGRKRKVTIPPRTSQQQTEGQQNEDQAHSSRGSHIQVETHFEEAGGPETQFDLGGPETQFGGQS
ncbi:OLC1v1016153C1 [Oldenlandia corymbosa var. corymbosa]|uniref:OLC1v1016153C1 n=1 Tax=Oldenlandia corymbosa var. corymbosa TaxID=529605 RepID=A0AAV1E5C9_OLDCO|nr:OLC1v1016153C1 [Oldenlandia corymbosa var. corymbosa]